MLHENLPPAIRRALADDRSMQKALFERPESLAALLPFDEFLEDGSIWRNKDGSLGVVFELSAYEHEVMTGDEILTAVRGLAGWFSLPSECSLQVIYDQARVSPSDPVFDEIATAYPKAHPVSDRLFLERQRCLQEAARSDGGPMRRTVLLALRYVPQEQARPSLLNVMGDGHGVLLHETEACVQSLKTFKGMCDDFVANTRMPLKRLTADDVLKHLRRFFNPRSFYERKFLPFNPSVSASEQVIFNSPVLDHAGIEREGIKTRTLSLKTSPQVAYPGGMAYFTRLGFPFRLGLSFSFPIPGKVKRFFDLKEFFLQNAPSARSRRQREEILAVQDRLARDDRCLQMTFTVVLEARTDEELDRQAREVTSVFQNDLGCEVIVEDMIGLGLCLNTLPLMYSPKADHSTRRAIRILRSDAITFLPVFDSFRGLSDPRQIYHSREKNLVKFSLTENETSNHTVVLADTGSGKSAFIIDCIQAAKRQSPEPLVFVIDKKSSYQMLSEFFDADLTVFERSGDVPFSPFRGVYDEDKIAFLTNLIASGIKLTSPSYVVESEHLAAIAKAIRQAHAKKMKEIGLTYTDGELRSDEAANVETFISMEEVVAELGALPSSKGFEKWGDTIDSLAQKLTPFYGEGLYARFFAGSAQKAGPKGHSLFFIYDLDALDNDPTLQALMTMAVVEEIRQTIKLPENKGRGGFIVLEEIGMIGRHNPHASQFIKDAAETFRKLGYWLIALTPRPQNYFETDAGVAMWGAADNVVFMQMSADNVAYLAEHSELLDETAREIVKSLRTVKNQYADVFYTNKKKTRRGAFRFVQTAYDRWLAPTNPQDSTAAQEALRRFSGDRWQALDFLAGRLHDPS